MSREVHVRFCESRGVRFPPATHLVVMCWSASQAGRALECLTALLADLGLEPKAAKTRIVHLEEARGLISSAFTTGWCARGETGASRR
jgi:hypothetical protein